MTTQHTPGIWRTTFDDRIESTYPIDTFGNITSADNAYRIRTVTICKMESGLLRNVLDEEERANARLIAAAPELLSTLQQLYSSFQHTDGNDKGNQAKTDVILYNEDVKAALNATMKLISKIK